MFKWLFLSLCFLSAQASAYDFYWSGNYSLEGNYLNSVDLGNDTDGDKAYLNHHLMLKPEIILFEGLSINGVLDILNAGGSTQPPGQRLGHVIGSDLSDASASYSSDVPYAFLQRRLSKTREVNLTEAYLSFSHVNGQLKFGRIPLEFGLGAFYNKGHKSFDHWYTTRDGVSYEFQMGSLSFKPMASIMSDALEDKGDALEFGLEFHFRVEDTGLDLGAMILQRHIPGTLNSGLTGVVSGAAKPTFYSLFYERDLKNYTYGFEAMFQNGDLGLDAAGNKVSLRGFGIAVEGEYRWTNFDLGLKLGYASGNDSSDAGTYSGVSFHRNYNLGLILFNHPLGASNLDALGTDLKGRRGALSSADYKSNKVADTDSVSNAFYLAPNFEYKFNSKWQMGGAVITAWLSETQSNLGDLSSYLGTEIDLTLTYKPTQNIIYKTTLGYLSTGSAFDGAGTLKTKDVFGLHMGLGVNF